jgi:hypothetical protein
VVALDQRLLHLPTSIEPHREDAQPPIVKRQAALPEFGNRSRSGSGVPHGMSATGENWSLSTVEK